MAVIAVESFDVNVGASGSTHTLTNDVGDISKAFVKINNSTDKSSSGPTGSTSNTSPNVAHCATRLTGTNELTFTKNTATEVKVVGEVWRYTGSAGGPNEFINRGTYAVTVSGTSASVAVSGIVDEDRCVPFMVGVDTSETSRSDYEQTTFAVHMDGSGNVVASRNNSGTTSTVYVNVVEFTGSNWNVGHGVSSSHDASAETITLNTDSTGTGGSTFDVGDWETAFIEATGEGDTAETGLSDIMFACYPAGTTTQVVVNYQFGDGSARNDGTAYVHVVQNDEIIVKRTTAINFAEGNGSYGSALAVPAGTNLTRNLRRYALEWFVDTSGTGTAHKRGSLGARINDGAAELTFNDGDAFNSGSYSSTLLGRWEFDISFPASPSGVIVEAGGRGTGMFVGYNDSGDFVARGGRGNSVAPSDCARLVIPPATYDFSSKSGTLIVTIEPTTNTLTLAFDENDTGTNDYSDSVTAASSFANWSGGDGGFVGNSNGNVAGSEITANYDFNGTISQMTFSQISADLVVGHWVHRSGNNVDVAYGVIDFAETTDSVSENFDDNLTRSEQEINYLDFVIESGSETDLTRNEQSTNYFEFTFDSQALLDLVRNEQALNYAQLEIELDFVIDLVRNEQSLNFIEFNIESEALLDLVRNEQALNFIEFTFESDTLLDLVKNEQVVNFLEFTFDSEALLDLVKNEQALNFIEFNIESEALLDLTRNEQALNFIEFNIESEALLDLTRNEQALNFIEFTFDSQALLDLVRNEQALNFIEFTFDSQALLDLVRNEQALNFIEFNIESEALLDLTRNEQTLGFIELRLDTIGPSDIRVGSSIHNQGGIRASSSYHSVWAISVDVNLVRNEQSLNYAQLEIELDFVIDLVRNEQSLNFIEFNIESEALLDLTRNEQALDYIDLQFVTDGGVFYLVRNEQALNFLEPTFDSEALLDLTRNEQALNFIEFTFDSEALLDLTRNEQALNFIEFTFDSEVIFDLVRNEQSVSYFNFVLDSSKTFLSNLVRNEQIVNYLSFTTEFDNSFNLIRSEQSVNYIELDILINEIEIDLVPSTKSLIGLSLDIVSDNTIPFYIDLEEVEWFVVPISYQLYTTVIQPGGTPPDPENLLTITITPDPSLTFTVYTELGTIPSYTLSANKSPVTYDIVSGVLPQEMELVGDTLVGGTVEEMDLYVPAFAMPPGTTIQIDGSHYATYGSALAGGYQFNCTIRGYYEGTLYSELAYVPFSVYVRNNYSSDRDKLIKDISETFGELGDDSEYRYFEIDGERVTYQEFIDHQKANGYYA